MQVTGAVSVNAAGGALLRIVHDGERLLCGPGRKYLSDLPTDGVFGEVKFSVTDSGYVKRSIFLVILKDIKEYCVTNNIPMPICLFVDGYGGHFHMDISNYCRENQIVLLGKFISLNIGYNVFLLAISNKYEQKLLITSNFSL